MACLGMVMEGLSWAVCRYSPLMDSKETSSAEQPSKLCWRRDQGRLERHLRASRPWSAREHMLQGSKWVPHPPIGDLGH